MVSAFCSLTTSSPRSPSRVGAGGVPSWAMVVSEIEEEEELELELELELEPELLPEETGFLEETYFFET